MKLYATTTSERASKGQGGNDFIQVLIQDENRNNIAQLNVFNDKEKAQYLTTFVPLNCQEFRTLDNGQVLAIETKTKRYSTAWDSGKGEKKKGERHIHDLDNYGKCCDCGEWVVSK